MAVEKRLYTVEEYEAFIALQENRDRSFELINGEIIEKAMVTQQHGRIAARLAMLLGIYLDTNPIGFVEVEVRYQIPNDLNALLPDVSVFLDTQTPVVERGAVPRMPDLAVEIKSPDDSWIDMRSKAALYLSKGTRLVWLIHPEKKLVEVYESGQDVHILLKEDTLTGDDVLPGFTLPLADLFKVLDR
jgi:Uma2 family endonuclease